MTRTFFIFLVLLTGQIFGQNRQIPEKGMDTLKSFQLYYKISSMNNCQTITVLKDPGSMTVEEYCNGDKKPIYKKTITVNKESLLAIKNKIFSDYKLLSFPDTINGSGYDGYSFMLQVKYNGKTKTIKGRNPKLENFGLLQDYIHDVVGLNETGPQ